MSETLAPSPPVDNDYLAFLRTFPRPGPSAGLIDVAGTSPPTSALLPPGEVAPVASPLPPTAAPTPQQDAAFGQLMARSGVPPGAPDPAVLQAAPAEPISPIPQAVPAPIAAPVAAPTPVQAPVAPTEPTPDSFQNSLLAKMFKASGRPQAADPATEPAALSPGDNLLAKLQKAAEPAAKEPPKKGAEAPEPAKPLAEGKQTGWPANIMAGIKEAAFGTVSGLVDPVLSLADPRTPTYPPRKGPALTALEWIGGKPEDVVPGSQGQAFGRAAITGALSAAIPGGILRGLARGAPVRLAASQSAGAAPLPANAQTPGMIGLGRGIQAGASVPGVIGGAAGGVGGLIGQELAPDSLKPLADFAGNIVAGTAAGTAAGAIGSAGRAVGRQASDARHPRDQIPGIVGRSILEDAGGKVPDFQAAPMAGVPLTVAQATPNGNPRFATALDTLGTIDQPGAVEQAARTNQGILEGLRKGAPASPAVAGIIEATPDIARGNASARVTNAIQNDRDGRLGATGIIAREESRLWNAPSLRDERAIASRPVQERFVQGAARILREDPTLVDTFDSSAGIQSAIKLLNGLPERTSAQLLNQASGQLRRIQRQSTDGAEKLIAGRLATELQEALWESPDVQGRPARSIPREAAAWDDAAGGVVPSGQPDTPHVIPAIPANRQLRSDLEAARAFTRREAEVLGHASFDAIVRRNSRGNETVTPEAALNKFYDFANGAERPGSITDVSKFLRDISSEYRRLNLARADGYDPAAIDAVARDLAAGNKDFLLSKLYSAITTNENDLGGRPMVSAAKAIQFVDRESTLLRQSGAFSPDELALFDSLKRTAEMIKTQADQSKGTGSLTAARAHAIGLMHPKNVADVFLGPLLSRAVPVATGALGAVGATLLGSGGIGSLIMTELGLLGAGGIGGHMGGKVLLNKLYAKPHNDLLAAFQEAYHNPVIARDLAQRAAMKPRPPTFSQETKDWARRLLGSEAVTQGSGHQNMPPVQEPPT